MTTIDTEECLSTNYITIFQISLKLRHQFLYVNFSQAQVNNKFITESQTKYQCDINQRHEACVTLDKLSL